MDAGDHTDVELEALRVPVPSVRPRRGDHRPRDDDDGGEDEEQSPEGPDDRLGDQSGRRVRLAGMPVEDERVGEKGQRQEEVRHDERGLQLEEHRQPAQDGLEEHADDEPY